MVKRIVLAVSFVVALGVAGLTTSSASAHGCGYGGGYRAAYYPTYYSYPVSYYRTPVYPVVYRDFDDHHHHHRHHGSGVVVSFGF
jgi:hypothetical protein